MSTGSFSVSVELEHPVVLMAVAGEIDAHTVPDLDAAFDAAVREHDRHVVLDASGISFIDSTGVSSLVAGLRRLNRSRRRLAVACQGDSPLGRALNMTGLHRTFDLHPTAEAAVTALAGAPMIGR